jgi:peptidoglycan/LPS O-acetylase OafA/YrhL
MLGTHENISKANAIPVHVSANGARIPSLDGLRAVSVALVLIYHAGPTLGLDTATKKWLFTIIGNGHLGVTTFLVISGFLITTLLMGEKARIGTVSLRDFYLRRAFRIWPAFYVYWCSVMILSAGSWIKVNSAEALSSAAFLWNYLPGSTWFLAHTWSLSLEEQFYLLWPLALKFLPRKQSAWLAVALIALEPAIRMGTYFLQPSLRGQIGMMLHTRADSLMMGALAALLYSNESFQRCLKRLYRTHVPAVAAFFVALVDPILSAKYRGTYSLPFGFALENLAILVVLLWSVHEHEGLIGRLLNSRIFVHVGLISYSLYLWQQLLLTVSNTTASGLFPINLVCTFIAAEASYYLVERTFQNWRKRILKARVLVPELVGAL